MPSLAETHARMLEHYAEGDLPWDDALPPPEVMETLAGLEAGRALDLGCGFGRASRFMAARGWAVDGVDFVAEAITTARERSVDFAQIRYYQGSITQLDFLQPPYDFAVDVGCGHVLSEADLALYRDELVRLLRSGGVYLCFGRMQDPDDENPAGFDEETLHSLFTPHFALNKVKHGETSIPDGSWQSAWYWWQKH